MGMENRGRAGWLEHLQETSPRHGITHDAGEREDAPHLPSALAEERLPGHAPEPTPRQMAFGPPPATAF